MRQMVLTACTLFFPAAPMAMHRAGYRHVRRPQSFHFSNATHLHLFHLEQIPPFTRSAFPLGQAIASLVKSFPPPLSAVTADVWRNTAIVRNVAWAYEKTERSQDWKVYQSFFTHQNFSFRIDA